jgi:hypothetical protein
VLERQMPQGFPQGDDTRVRGRIHRRGWNRVSDTSKLRKLIDARDQPFDFFRPALAVS